MCELAACFIRWSWRSGRRLHCLSIDCVSTVSAASGRYRLGSTGSAAYVLPRTRTKFGERGFFYSGPAAWNTLPSDLHDITDTSTFRKRLKNILFDRAYNWLQLTIAGMSRIAVPYKSRVDWLIDWSPVTITEDSNAYVVCSVAMSCHIIYNIPNRMMPLQMWCTVQRYFV